jgi:hypothetical protein
MSSQMVLFSRPNRKTLPRDEERMTSCRLKITPVFPLITSRKVRKDTAQRE